MNSATSRLQSSKAFRALADETRSAKSFRRFIADYGAVLAVVICYGSIAWSRGSSSTLDFLGVLVIIFMLHAASEQRAQRRLELLAGALDELQRTMERDDT